MIVPTDVEQGRGKTSLGEIGQELVGQEFQTSKVMVVADGGAGRFPDMLLGIKLRRGGREVHQLESGIGRQERDLTGARAVVADR